MQYHSFLIRRYLLRRFIPYAAVIAVAFGIFSLIAVLAVMEGFKDEMRGRIRGSLAHLTLLSHYSTSLHGAEETIDRLLEVEHIEAAAPFVTAIAVYKSNSVDFCIVRGIDPAAEARVGDFARYLMRQDEVNRLLEDEAAMLPEDRTPLSDAEIEEMFSLDRRRKLQQLSVFQTDRSEGGFQVQSPPQPMVVGIEALRRGTMRIGHTVQLTSFSPQDLEPRVENFLVVGAFQTQVFEQDQRWVFLPIRAAQEFLGLYDEEVFDYRLSGISVRLDDYRNSVAVRDHIETEVVPSLPCPEAVVYTWEEQKRNLLRAVDVEKRIITVMMMLIILFAGVMIFLILTLMVIEKTRDLGVLRSLGATRRGVVGLFLRQGLLLTGVGMAVGTLSGWLLVENINAIHDAVYAWTGLRLFPPDIYYLTRIPTKLRWQEWAVILTPALAFGFLGSIIPAFWAARRDPVKALHHE